MNVKRITIVSNCLVKNILLIWTKLCTNSDKWTNFESDYITFSTYEPEKLGLLESGADARALEIYNSTIK